MQTWFHQSWRSLSLQLRNEKGTQKIQQLVGRCEVKDTTISFLSTLIYCTAEISTIRNSCYVNVVLNGVDLSHIVEQTSLSHGLPATSKPLGCFREALNHYKQIGHIQNYYFDDAEVYDDRTKMHMCYSSQVTVILPNSTRAIIGSSSVAFPQKQLAREEAAKSAVRQLECLLPKPVPHQPQKGIQ